MRKKKNKTLGPVTTIILITIIVMIITSILSLIGFEGQQTIITNGILETYLITIKNIFSIEGIKSFFGNSIINLQTFKPLFYLIMSLISLGIAERSGLIKAIAEKIKKLKFKYLTILVMTISIISIFFGDYSFAFLMPFVALIYKHIGKNPILGIITVFLALTLGYGLGIFYDYQDYSLGIMTELSAQVDVDKTYSFNLLSNLYIMIFSSAVLVIVCSNLIETKIAPKFNNPEVKEDEIIISKEAGQYTLMALMLLLLLIIYLIIPGSPYMGFLLDKEQPKYIAMLLGDNSPFNIGFPYIVMIIMMICSFIYGKTSKNIKTSYDYNEGLAAVFDKTGYIFVLIFFISQLIGLLEWTNIGNVITVNLLDFMSGLQFSGLPLIFISFLIIVFITILIPSSMDKWILFSPIIIPLFMRSNITPDYTQHMFSVADSVGKVLTPIFPYYIIMLGLIYKYKNQNDISLFGIIKLTFPVTMILSGLLLLILLSWFLIGLPLGINSFPSL